AYKHRHHKTFTNIAFTRHCTSTVTRDTRQRQASEIPANAAACETLRQHCHSRHPPALPPSRVNTCQHCHRETPASTATATPANAATLARHTCYTRETPASAAWRDTRQRRHRGETIRQHRHREITPRCARHRETPANAATETPANAATARHPPALPPRYTRQHCHRETHPPALPLRDTPEVTKG
ncbi:uncharacterized protein LOC121867572, partial [Homarus americanus]|uniref:uncharacterized protein LOC121867572 n=1 Tax=Homarus americanus TaxID=6706 RepID=UPI001C44270D